MVFPVEKRKSEVYYWILQNRISLSTKFQLKFTILIFWARFTQKVYFCSKTEKTNMTIEFWIIELF